MLSVKDNNRLFSNHAMPARDELELKRRRVHTLEKAKAKRVVNGVERADDGVRELPFNERI